MSDTEKKVRTLNGQVISTKTDKTITVLVERISRHPVYGKYIKRSSKLLAHDGNNECKEGDYVAIASCRPMSKRKNWTLVEIIDKNK